MYVSSAEKRPGLSPVTAAPKVVFFFVFLFSVFLSVFMQTEAPHSLSLSRGEEEEWNPRSTTFWAYLPPQVGQEWPNIRGRCKNNQDFPSRLNTSATSMLWWRSSWWRSSLVETWQ